VVPGLPGSELFNYATMYRSYEAVFLLIRRIESASSAKTDCGMGAMITTLRASMDALFQSEEAIMRSATYSAAEDHKRQHEELRNQMRCLAAVADQGCMACARYAVKMLRVSLQWHLNSMDRNLLDYQTTCTTSPVDVRRAFRCDGESHCLVVIDKLPLR